MHQYDLALSDFTQAIEIAPEYVASYIERGNNYYRLQKYEKALTDYKQAIEIDPSKAMVYVNVGAMLGNSGELKEALPYFEKAAQLGLPQGTQYAERVRQSLKDNTGKA